MFALGDDAVRLDLVASFNRPSGNAAGINVLTEELETKRLLRDVGPGAASIAVLLKPKSPGD